MASIEKLYNRLAMIGETNCQVQNKIHESDWDRSCISSIETHSFIETVIKYIFDGFHTWS